MPALHESPPTIDPDHDGTAAPRAEYQRRRDARRAVADRLERRSARIADARLGAFVAGLAVTAASLWGGWFSPWWVVVPVAGLFGLVIASDAVGRRERRARRQQLFYEAGLDRLEDRWAGKGDAGERFAKADHPFDADLDLFGAGSLFERLCTARTGAGKATLAHWLLEPAGPEEVRGRQGAVEELRGRLDLREDIALLGDDVESGLHPAALIAWGEGPSALSGKGLPIAASALGVANVATLVGWAFLDFNGFPFLVAVAATLGFHRLVQGRLARATSAIDERAAELRVLADLLARIEREPFDAPRLRAIRDAMASGGEEPSRRIARLAGYATLLEFRRNQFFAPIAFLVLWQVHLSIAIERWRRRSGALIVAWLDAVGQFEALCALSSYAFESPADPFPDLTTEGGGPLFEATALGHPLIARDQCVRNDVAIGGPDRPRVLLVSGSNMSGKSTLLRSIGVNAVLAMAGAPVRAGALTLSPLKVGATLRVQDSLQAGRSRFYAEITRLRQLVDLAATPPPLLFLIDEVLHGTNSHDRRLGAEGVVRGLLDRGAIGLVTTHDLALAEVVDALGPIAANVHFEDQMDDGELRFDYVMRPGVVRKSNALALMRAVGLDV